MSVYNRKSWYHNGQKHWIHNGRHYHKRMGFFKVRKKYTKHKEFDEFKIDPYEDERRERISNRIGDAIRMMYPDIDAETLCDIQFEMEDVLERAKDEFGDV